MILLDEIEKAHPDVFNILLQVLEDGRLTDNKGRMANFKNCIVIMTSNIGSEIIREEFEKIDDNNTDSIVESTRLKIFELLKRSVRPEFLNRIDEIIMFRPLTRKDIRGIIDLQIKLLDKVLKKQDITITLSPSCIDYINEKGFDPQFGARPLKRVIQKEILDGLSLALLDGRVEPGDDVRVDYDGEIRFSVE